MIALATETVKPSTGGMKRQGYDNGFRMGVFDKCNGKPHRALDGIANTKYNRAYVKGYLDGYHSSDVEIGNGMGS